MLLAQVVHTEISARDAASYRWHYLGLYQVNDDKPGVSSLETMSCRKQCPKDWASIWSCWWNVFCMSIGLGICIMKSWYYTTYSLISVDTEYNKLSSTAPIHPAALAPWISLQPLHCFQNYIQVSTWQNPSQYSSRLTPLSWRVKIDRYMIWWKNNM